ncbi:protein enabled homolog [Penaeus japonicus]|uniref:protein enabled homolog n=1 Tax=Penaeus japonicus TaxID=27405 RepID=UPI001C70B6F8|nr:protein enabled homolog [Penaeus japonicus]
MKQEEESVTEAASTPAIQEEGKGNKEYLEKEEEEEEVNEIQKEEENTQEASARSLSDDETSDGRSLYRGGVTRRGLLQRDDLPPKVIVTSSVGRGQLLDDTYAQDRNLPPPRLIESPDMNQREYRVNYPGAKLRVAAPLPSHLTQPHILPPGSSSRQEPQAINFGSSSLSKGAFHHARDPSRLEYPPPLHAIPRTPVTFYNPAHAAGRPPLRQRPYIRRKITPAPQSENPQPLEPFRPSKLLPPITPAPPTAFSSPPTQTPTPTSTPTTTPTPTTAFQSFSRSRWSPSVHPNSYRPSHPRPPHRLLLPSPQGGALRPTTTPTPTTAFQSFSRSGERESPERRRPTTTPRPRRGQVMNAPRPLSPGLSTLGDALSPLGTISKSGVRPEIGHRAGTAGGRRQNTQGSPYRRPQNNQSIQNGYQIGDEGRYNFVAGQVFTPPALINRPNIRTTEKTNLRITTMRPRNEMPLVPYEDNRSAYVPRYVKEAIAEMEFEPKTIDAPLQPHSTSTFERPHWFLMPVQGWFVLSIILAALVIVLAVLSGILYNSLRKQKRKVKKLVNPGLLVGPCVDPLKHERCQCRTLAPLVRSQTLLSRASVVSRASNREMTMRRSPSRHQGIINYDNAAQQMTTGFRSLPNPALMDRDVEKDNNLDSITTTHTQLEVEDTPPPLAPKRSSLTGASGGQESRLGAGGRESRAGGRESRAGGRESRLGAYENRMESSDGRMGGGFDGRGWGRSSNCSGNRMKIHTTRRDLDPRWC